MAEYGFEAMRGHNLKTLQGPASALFAFAKQSARINDGIETDPNNRTLSDCWPQQESGCGHDAERSFRSDQQLLEIETAIVLLQWHKRVENAAIGHHRFDAQYLGSHRSVAQHLSASGIGRYQAAHGRGSFPSQSEREAELLGFGGFVQCLEYDTGLAHDLPGPRIHLPDAVHPAHGQKQYLSALVRCRAA